MFRKFATFMVLGTCLVDETTTSTRLSRFAQLGRTAHRARFDYTPRYGFLYVRSRMISSRCNDNFDEFPAEEIKKAYRTFIGKPVFVNHHNDDHRNMRGIIIDAALHEDHNPDGSPDTWVEGLMEIDALRYPKLAEALIKKQIERTSMGVDVEYSICSKCGNKAATPLEYCRHVPGMKGKVSYRITASGRKVGELIREKCYGLRFFENSLLVEAPADPTAYTLGSVELGPGLEHLSMMRIASRIAQHPIDQVTVRSISTASSSQGIALRLVAGMKCAACYSADTISDQHGNNECFDCGYSWNHREAAAQPRYQNPADHPWFQATPVHHKNIVRRWNEATEDEKTQGKNWYSDAHIIAKAIAANREHPAGSAHLGAGIVANYSPQKAWAGNMHNAARVLHEGKGLGGPGSGLFASKSQASAADRMLAGERHEEVLKGPKIQDFAHLIEHGGDADPNNPKAVIDRHALSVATGRRMNEEDYNTFPKNNRHYYGHVVQQYHQAAKQISKKEGEPVAAHQVQAVTWLVQQRQNQAAERAAAEAGSDSRLDRGRERARKNQETAWHEFREQHYPNLPNAGPGTGYQASRRVSYGETKAPADVDTLRDEACPVCGETDSWDGNECQVCGFVAPPKEFQDPDVDMAKRVDLRKDVGGDLEGTDVSDLNDDLNDRDKDGLDDETGEPIEGTEGDVQPLLACSNCGTEFEAGEPMTTDTRDPQAGDAGTGPDEGDVCPACGKGVLESGTELAESDPDDLQREEDPDTEEKDSAQESAPDTDFRGIEDEDEDDNHPEDEEKDQDPDQSSDDEPPAKKRRNPFKQ